jgi:hypothetical protein
MVVTLLSLALKGKFFFYFEFAFVYYNLKNSIQLIQDLELIHVNSNKKCSFNIKDKYNTDALVQITRYFDSLEIFSSLLVPVQLIQAAKLRHQPVHT